MFKDQVKGELESHFGLPIRTTKKVWAWEPKNDIGLVLQRDQPNNDDLAYVWLPHPGDDEEVPEIAFEYPGEMGRHSNTYPSKGLAKGEPALLFRIRTIAEAMELIGYINSNSLTSGDHKEEEKQKLSKEEKWKKSKDPWTSENSEVSCEPSERELERVNVQAMPKPEEKKPRRKAIPRVVQREVWQRDGGRCVECDTRKLLCYDHIVPFSLGGSNTVRNIQLLCESCNLSKGNRI